MSAVNDTNVQHEAFILTGIPGLEELHVWISSLFFLIYLIAILGNTFILFVIKTDPSLHEPMYILLSMLAITDLGISISTMLTTLRVLWFNSREITHDACFAQLFFIHSLTYSESSILMSMAFDRFVAICKPLRYASILTPHGTAKMGLLSFLRGFGITFPLPILLKQYRYCQDNVLFHSYCLNQEVMKLACSDIGASNIYGFFITVSSAGLDLLLTLLSYVMILKTVLSLTSHVGRLKALNTCISHVCVFLLFYIPGICLSVMYRFMKSSSPLFQNVLGNIYLLIPPLMNPIVYSIKTKPIRERIIRIFNH